MASYLLIDGNSLTYRAFFALPTDIATASGQVTNAVYGFTSMLVNLLRDHKPDHVAVAFDRPEPTFRHVEIETYKANRTAAPDILREQMGLVRQMVDVLKIPVLELAGFEADDIIATLATVARDRGDDVIIVTGDRDAYQLVEDPHIKVLYNKRGVSDYAFYDEAGIKERTGVTPADYVQYAALRGDPSDNLPGVPGVGEKTAAKLINTYGGLDGIFANIDKQTPKLRANLSEYEPQVRKNAEVMVLVRDVPIETDPETLNMGDVDPDEVHRLFSFLEFRNQSLNERLAEVLGSQLVTAPIEAAEELEAEVRELRDPTEAVAVVRALIARGTPVSVAGRWVADEGRSALLGLAVVVDRDARDVVFLPTSVVEHEDLLAPLRALFTDVPIVAHGAKALIRSLHVVGEGVDVRSLRLDTMIAAYLLDPAESKYVLDELLRRYAHRQIADSAAVPDGQLDFGGESTAPALETARRALAIEQLIEPLSEALRARGLSKLHDEIEIPLVRVLAGMEAVGVAVDVEVLRELNKQMIDDCDRLTRAIWADAGEEFNVNSTPKLREILFDRLGLAPQKKTKTGYSTDASSLEKLIGLHPIIEHLLAYREVEKLRSTYGEGLLAAVDPRDGRIHATFNQTVARTGRLSSDQPNLHNIPVRSEGGRAFRKAFVPGEGFEFLIADYNQIELRCIAHLAEDPGLIAAFESGTDIHTETAARVFAVEHDAVTLEQRSKAKMVSYGLAYGMEAYGLGQRLAIPTSEAQTILDAYFVAFPSVKAYMEATVAEARTKGYTETLFGRRRQIPELSSSNFRIRQAGERQAMNAGIQGLAADIFKVALVHLDEGLERGGFRSRVVLQVHDEVILELDPLERDDVTTLTLDAMSGAFDLRVPLEVNLSYGASWAAAKS